MKRVQKVKIVKKLPICGALERKKKLKPERYWLYWFEKCAYSMK